MVLTMICVQGLTREFHDYSGGAFRALDDVTFEVRPGEIFGLLGPNGAGKTTCLRILSTVLKPTRGLAEVAGLNVMKDAEGVRRSIGFMSNNTGIYDRMTAFEMVQYFGRLYGIPEDRLQIRIDEIFDTLQMNDFRDLTGGKMSTGMKQKVSIARTIVHDPPVIIFDEPTSGLDVLVARNVLETVEVLKDQGKCIIYSTHIMSEVDKLCERIAIIHRGCILAKGRREDLVAEHNQPNVEELFFDLIRRHNAEQANNEPPVNDSSTATSVSETAGLK
jgi:sodium transport system ATP-binding protein